MRTPTIVRKTVGDVGNPYLLAGFLAPMLVISFFFGLAMSGNAVETDGATLAQQTTQLHGAFAGTAFFISLGSPYLALAAIFPALTVAREAEAGTFKLLLSKPIKRWQYFAGTFVGVTVYGTLMGVVSVLLLAVFVVELSGVAAAAIEPAIFSQLAGNVAFAFVGMVVVCGFGFGLAVLTNDRLRTALGGLVLPALFFAFLPIRALSGASYTDYGLYLIDVSYHFGNLYVFLHEVFGDIPVETQESLIPWTGVYAEPSGEELPASLELTGHVSMELSVALLLAIGLGGFAVGLVRFRSMDV